MFSYLGALYTGAPVSLAKRLIALGARPHIWSHMGQTLLHARGMSADYVALLLSHGALVMPSTDPMYHLPVKLTTVILSYSTTFWNKWPLSEAIARSEEAVSKLMVRDFLNCFSPLLLIAY